MSIQIECLRCGHTSDNPFGFNNRRFAYRDEIGAVKTIHLCSKCQEKVLLAINKTMAEFLGIDTVSKWMGSSGGII